jgi:riboflavin synthase
MFTGIITHQAEVMSNTSQSTGHRLMLKSPLTALVMGESIAVNGVCLTLCEENEGVAAFDVSPETLDLTTLGGLLEGQVVNLERALMASDRMGGHYVSGHVDTTATILSIEPHGEYICCHIGEFKIPAGSFLVTKGSITVDGVSLTINKATTNEIELMLIPHTLTRTSLAHLKAFDTVNIEFDYLTRIVAHQLALQS